MIIIQVSFGWNPTPYDGAGGDSAIYYMSDSIAKLPDSNVIYIDLKSPIHKNLKTEFVFREVMNTGLKSNSIIKHTIKMAVFSLCVAWEVLKLSLSEKIDIVHLHNQFPATAVILIKRLFGLKFKTIYTIHNATILIANPRYWIYKPLEKYVLRNIDHVIATTPAVMKFIVDEMKIERKKVSHIYLGMELKRISEFMANNKREHLIEKNILYVGSICSRKNQMALVRSLPMVIREIPEAKCILVGNIVEKNYRALIERFAREHSIENKVIFLGGVDRNEMYRHLLNATISVITSQQETLGLVLIEAMAFGLPVIASNIGPFMNLVSMEPDSAMVVNAENTNELAANIISLLKSNEQREKMSLAGRKLAAYFTWESIAIQTRELYIDILSK